ncbi:MAG TPA: DUF4202 domain-containing protein [Opitutae bacterium]|nr:DUF4202 domain-containing protein [Opitutae bacterium]
MTFKTDARFQKAIETFDGLNSQDPNLVDDLPKELRDAQAMTLWVDALYPNATEAVHLAARCQHLCRWERPRDSYPEGRAGYLKWRSDLKQFHADRSAEVLRSVGYGDDMLAAVTEINLKKGLKTNPDVQMIEDALCLVFLELQYEGYVGEWDDEKIVRILKKTWGKMSEVGHAAALKLKYSEPAMTLIEKALA